MNAQLTTSLRDPDWRASPSATLFRSHFRRLWNPRTLRTALWALAAVIVTQLVIGFLAEHSVMLGRSNFWRGLVYGSSALGLYSSWTTALYSGLGVLPARGTAWYFAYPVWLTVSMGLLTIPLQMLAPAFAAQSIAPDRENHRIEELLLAGFTPRQILVAKGLASLAPFLALWLFWEVVTIGLQVSGIAHRPTLPNVRYSAPPAPWISIAFHFCYAVTTLARLAILVCLSALCRRQRNALVACYGFAFLWPLLSQAAFLLVAATSGKEIMQRAMLLNLATPLVILAVLAVLLPKALQAIVEPGGMEKPALRSMRIMEYGAEEPGE